MAGSERDMAIEWSALAREDRIESDQIRDRGDAVNPAAAVESLRRAGGRW